MLTIIKSYYIYHKYASLAAIVFVLLINLILALSGDWFEAQDDFPGLRVVWIAVVSILYLIFHVVSNHEKRIRIHRILPISSFTIALSRLLSVLTFWIVTLFILLLFNFVMNSSLPNAKWIFDTAALTGFIATINAYPLIYRDLIAIPNSARGKIIISGIYASITIMISGFLVLSVPYLDAISPSYIHLLGNELYYLYLSSIGKLFLILLGICFSAISIILFTKRKTYLV
jgi:hypothetical protein